MAGMGGLLSSTTITSYCWRVLPEAQRFDQGARLQQDQRPELPEGDRGRKKGSGKSGGVEQPDGRQYVLDDDGEPVYGVWFIPRDEADVPMVVEGPRSSDPSTRATT
jgi:hypothetical protein